MSLPDSSLFDITPATETVVAGGQRHKVTGAPLAIALRVGGHIPSLWKLFVGGGSIPTKELAEAPEAVAEFIAAGFGLEGNKDAIAKAASLPLYLQIALFTGVLKASMGGGAGPFAEMFADLLEVMNFDSETVAALLLKRKKTSANGSQKPSNSSVREVATTPPVSGN